MCNLLMSILPQHLGMCSHLSVCSRLSLFILYHMSTLFPTWFTYAWKEAELDCGPGPQRHADSQEVWLGMKRQSLKPLHLNS